MIRFLAEYLLYPLLVFLVLRAILRTILAAMRGPSRPSSPQRSAPEVQPGGELKKDPICGTYVSTTSGFTRTVNGEVLYFCSQECREKYAAR